MRRRKGSEPVGMSPRKTKKVGWWWNESALSWEEGAESWV
jgi:hypothetical protein